MNIFDSIKDAAVSAYGNADKTMFRGYLPGGASREASQNVPQVPFSPGDIADKGLIPIPTIIPEIEGGAKFVKSYAGDAGKIFRVEPAIIGRDEYLQDQVNRSTIEDGKTSYGLTDKGYKAPKGLREQLKRGIYGQTSGNVESDGSVTIVEGNNQPYDTNQPASFHKDNFDTAWKNKDYGAAVMHKIYESYAGRQAKGLTNTAPQGTSKQTLGYVSKPQPAATRKAGEADITVEATAPPDPQMSYAVRAGDTLSAIARSKGTTVDALAKLNNISNVNQIGIGQQLRY